jgi:hypothetical protein
MTPTRAAVVASLVVAAAACVAGAVVGVTPAAADPGDDITVSVSVSEADIWSNETFDATITVENTGFRPHDISRVFIRESGGETRAVGTTDDLLRPNEQTTYTVDGIPVDTGVNELEAVVEHTPTERYSSTRETAAYFEVVGSDPTPTLSLSVTGAGESASGLRLTVGNPHEGELTRVEATVRRPENASVAFDRRTVAFPRIAAGETRTATFGIRGSATGEVAVPVSVSFVTADGRSWTRTRSVPVVFGTADRTPGSASNPVQLDLSSRQGFIASERTLTLTVANSQRDAITSIEATLGRPRDSSITVTDRRSILPTIEGGETGTLTFSIEGASASDVEFPVTISYESPSGVTVEATRTLAVSLRDPVTDVRPAVSPVRLTGVTTSGSSSVTVQGEVANVQSASISGITVRVRNATGVAPGDPGEFFVGSLDGGVFNSFGPVRATLTADRDTVPVVISYSYNGTKYRTVTDVAVTDIAPRDGGGGGNQSADSSLPSFGAGATENGSGGGSGGSQILLAAAGVAVLAAAGIVGVVLKRR